MSSSWLASTSLSRGAHEVQEILALHLTRPGAHGARAIIEFVVCLGPARGSVVLVALALASPVRAADAPEARVSFDAKHAPVTDVVRVLAEAGGFQVVFDPGQACSLTLKLHEVRWRAILDTALAACSLGVEEEGDILRVAPVAKLREEAAARRRLNEERQARPQGRLALFRLSYARAQQLAPLLDRIITPAGRVSYDERTNTLIVAY